MNTNLKIRVIAVIFVLAIPFSLAGYDNSPSYYQILPEVIWAAATGGGVWTTEVQITDVTGGSQVYAYFFYGGGNFRGSPLIWTSPAVNNSTKILNILEYMQTLDPGFNYYGRVGTIWFDTHDTVHKILVAARTVNGNYSKTFPGLGYADSNTAAVGRKMAIQNLVQNSTYRSTVGFFNPTSASVTVTFMLVSSINDPIGDPFDKTFGPYDFQAFYPFAAAGVSGTYDNVWLSVIPTSGTGKIFCFGATANNITNDPATHIAVQLQ